jgi:hypothetical protein
MEKLITTLQRFMGTEEELGEMDTIGLKIGSTFYSTDIDRKYVWDGAQWIKEIPNAHRRIKSWHGQFDVSTTALTKELSGDCTVNVILGRVWINTEDTAVADDTSIQLSGSIDLRHVGDLSLISNSTGATVQIIEWED